MAAGKEIESLRRRSPMCRRRRPYRDCDLRDSADPHGGQRQAGRAHHGCRSMHAKRVGDGSRVNAECSGYNFICLSVSLCLSLSVSFFLSLSLSVFLSLSLSFSFFLSLTCTSWLSGHARQMPRRWKLH